MRHSHKHFFGHLSAINVHTLMNKLESKLDFIISPKSIWLEQPGFKPPTL